MPKKSETVVVPFVEETPVISDIPTDSEVEEEPKSVRKSKRPRTEKQKEAFLLVIQKGTEARALQKPESEKQ